MVIPVEQDDWRFAQQEEEGVEQLCQLRVSQSDWVTSHGMGGGRLRETNREGWYLGVDEERHEDATLAHTV